MVKIATPSPLLLGPDQHIVVTNAVIALSALPAAATHAFVDIQDQPVMMTLDGTNPSTTDGHKLLAGEKYVWPKAYIAAAKFIRQGGTDAAIHCTPLVY